MNLNSRQKLILEKLLHKYEGSKTYKGENFVRQTFSIAPTDVYPKYNDDFEDVNSIEDFEKELKNLESENLISTESRNQHVVKISANTTDDYWPKVRNILGVKERKLQQQEELNFFRSFLSKNSVIVDFCKTQISRIEADKKAAYPLEESANIINLLDYILSDHPEILERELSIEVLHDSKKWEKIYRTKVCKILQESGIFHEIIDGLEETKEIYDTILENLNVYKNPSYIYFKGSAKIKFTDGRILDVMQNKALALPSTEVSDIDEIDILNKTVMTIENLTSFNRVRGTDVFFLYLSGYHNSIKQVLLKKIFDQNQSKNILYYHFGDIDPDGFYILENLRKKTEIDFKPYCMDVKSLKKYRNYTKSFESNDIKKAESLIAVGKYVDIATYMLNNKIKLEQEIISWMSSDVDV
ncbi:Wadjet anti-phage system protein JetD domain-containing protein [uncultured Fibrobacter sp.]|uniref:Wadjet anti-phage system protein JetD domain-containing protein n=1 Tax=uncultured Fibrobacter sp. TaxID=261512 RepID=UPI0025FCA1AA|nr:Wadjet anti-phage system protein JetD domain-containing protein [uncultured Fibrobacter sp.]